MATDKPNADAVESAGGPDAAPSTAGTPASVTPTGSAEPAKQAVSGTASPAPGRVVAPTRSEYEMPDDYASDSPLDAVKQWARANPGLAVVAAAGGGFVLGRVITALLPKPKPETLAQRVEAHAKTFKADARHTAAIAGDSIQERLAQAAEAIRDAVDSVGDHAQDGAERAREIAEDGAEKARDLADVVSDAVKVAVSGAVAKKADSWLGRLRS